MARVVGGTLLPSVNGGVERAPAPRCTANLLIHTGQVRVTYTHAGTRTWMGMYIHGHAHARDAQSQMCVHKFKQSLYHHYPIRFLNDVSLRQKQLKVEFLVL